jgi:pimeloyl-[acyl-carrier protein] methyl ester esterase
MNWLLLRGLGREQRHWHDFPERLRALVAPEPVFLLDLAGTGTERSRWPPPSVPWLARDIARRASQLPGWLPSAAPSGAARDAGWCLLGLSLGGMVALELCGLWTERVAHAIVINSSARITGPTARLQPRALQGLGRALFARGARAREEHVLALTSQLPAADRHDYAERAAAFADGAPSRRALVSQLCAAARFSPPRAGRVSARLCFLASRCDRLVSVACSRDLACRYGAPYLEHPWAGHDLPLDDPDWICERVAGIRRGNPVT